METMSYSPYQMKVIELMRHVQSEDQMKEISHLLSEYFAHKAIEEADRLWEQQMIDGDKIEEWKKEHSRTPYQWITPNVLPWIRIVC